MPIPGIFASQMTGHLTTFVGAYDALASVTLSATTQSIIFTVIPNTYKHLQIRAFTKSSSTQDSIDLTFNGDTSSSYGYHAMYGYGTGTGAEGEANRANIPTNIPAVSSANTNMFGAGVIDILDYNNIYKNKTIRTISGWETNGAGTVYVSSGVWLNNSAITSIKLTERSYNFAIGTTVALYGVK
jgi:hypothetical protein